MFYYTYLRPLFSSFFSLVTIFSLSFPCFLWAKEPTTRRTSSAVKSPKHFPATRKTMTPSLLNRGKLTKKSHFFKIIRKISLPAIPSNLCGNRHYLLVSSIVGGNLSLIDSKKMTLLKSVHFSDGKLQADIDAKRAIVAVMNWKKILLLELPSLKVLRTFILPFKPYRVKFLPVKRGVPTHIVISDYLHDRVHRLDLKTGKIDRTKAFPWPSNFVWTEKMGIITSSLRKLYFLERPTWKILQVKTLPYIADQLLIRKGRLFLIWGYNKHAPGALRLYRFPKFSLMLTRKTSPIPRYIALSERFVFVLSGKAVLDIYDRRAHLKKIQSLKLSIDAAGLSLTSNGVAVALPRVRQLLFLAP